MGLLAAKEFRDNNQQPYTIRSAEPMDASSILKSLILIAETGPYILATAEKFRQMPVEKEEQFLLTIKEDPRSIMLVAISGTTVAAIGDLQCYRDEKRTHVASLGVSVHPDFRCQGVGTVITQALIDWGRAVPGLETIKLSVMEPNKHARKIYQSLGFQAVAQFPRAYRLGPDQYADDITMILNLRS